MKIRQKQLWWTRGVKQARKLQQKMWNIHKDTKNSYTYYNYNMTLNNAKNDRVQREVMKKWHVIWREIQKLCTVMSKKDEDHGFS